MVFEQSTELLLKIGIVLALGALVGFERERRGKEAGVRTFMLIALLGLVLGMASEFFGPLVLVLGLAGIMVVAGLAYFKKIKSRQAIGLTTVVAMLVMFVIGALAFHESYPPLISVSIGVIMALVLVSKEKLHKFAHHLKKIELLDIIILAILSFVITPLLPNKPVDPWGIFNPLVIWVVIVLVLAIEFVSYVAMKILGASRGMEVMGVLAGFVSSTAFTVAISQKIRKQKNVSIAAFAVGAATSVMFLRMWIFASIINISLVSKLWPLILISVAGFAVSLFILPKKGREAVTMGSPLELISAFKFGILFIALIGISYAANLYFGPAGVFAASFIGGLADADGVVLGVSTLSNDGFGTGIASVAVILAATANSISKLIVTRYLGSKALTRKLLPVVAVHALIGLGFVLFSLAG